MLEIGQEWLLYATPFRLKETTTPANVTIPQNTLALYAKDNGSGVSQLCIKNDAFNEVCIPTSGTIITGTGVAGRVAFWDDVDNLSSDADLTFAVDTLTGTKIVATTALTLSALTATRLVLASTGGLLADDSTLTFVRNDGDFAAPIFLGDNSHTGVINTPAGLTINIDSDANDTGALFVIQSNTALRLTGGSRLITVNELGAFGVGSGPSFGSSGQFLASAGNAASPTWTTHDSTGDPHTQYALLAGRSGGQILKGGIGSGDDLQLISTDHATKGSIIFGTGSTYDEANDRLGIGLTTTPFQKVHIRGTEIDVGILSDYFGDGPNAGFFAVRNNRGTVASPTATQNNDILGTILWQGRYGTTAGDADIQNGVVLRGIATENWTGSAIGAQLSMFLTVKGSTAQVEMLKFKIADDVSQIVWNNHGASKQMNFTWQDNGTDKWILYKTTDNIFNIYYSPTGSSLIRCNPVDGNPSVSAVVLGLGTITTTQTNYSAVSVQPLLNGSGDGPQGFNIGPAIRPSANVNNAYGYLALPAFGPASGATITNAFGFYSRFDTANTGGAIGNGYTGFFAAPTFDTLKPTSMFGAYIQNQGSASITNVVGLRLDAQSGGTNNWVMELPADATDPTSGGGAATGRIACVIGGVTRYIPYY